MNVSTKRDIEQEATQAMRDICDLIDLLLQADSRLFKRLEREFQKAIAQANFGYDTEPTLAEPHSGWSLCASDLIRHIREVWMDNVGVPPMSDKEISIKYCTPATKQNMP